MSFAFVAGGSKTVSNPSEWRQCPLSSTDQPSESKGILIVPTGNLVVLIVRCSSHWISDAVLNLQRRIRMPKLISDKIQAGIDVGNNIDFPSEIVVKEDCVDWYAEYLENVPDGIKSSQHRLLSLALAGVKHLRPEYGWLPLFRDPRTGQNIVKNMPRLFLALNQLWSRELSTPFSITQEHLVLESDCILIAFDLDTNAVLAFGTSRYSPRGEIPGVPYQTTHGGLCVVAKEHQSRKITPLIASIVSLYGHTVSSVFKQEVIVVRSNNRFVEKILRRAEPVYRSDEISEFGNDTERIIAIAMRWTHEHVFHQVEGSLSFSDRQIITHRVPESARSAGLEENESIYFSRVSSLIEFLFRVFFHRRKGSPRVPTRIDPPAP